MLTCPFYSLFSLAMSCMNVVLIFYGIFKVDGDGNFDCLSSMGFSMLHNFEEVNCDAATWTMMHPS